MFGKKMTPAIGPVNVNRFTIYALIPGPDSYVASKLDKKKFVTIYPTVFVVAILATTMIVMYDMSLDPELIPDLDKKEKADMIFAKFMPQMLVIIIGFAATHFLIYTYLIRKWAKEWNMTFEN